MVDISLLGRKLLKTLNYQQMFNNPNFRHLLCCHETVRKSGLTPKD